MKNIFALLLSVSLLVTAGAGCSLIESTQPEGTANGPAEGSGSNKSVSDTVVDTAVGETKIGIKACDDAVDLLNSQINDPDENFVTKAIKKTALNQFRDSVKKSLEENGADKQAVEQFCVEFKKNLESSLSEAPKQ